MTQPTVLLDAALAALLMQVISNCLILLYWMWIGWYLYSVTVWKYGESELTCLLATFIALLCLVCN